MNEWKRCLWGFLPEISDAVLNQTNKSQTQIEFHKNWIKLFSFVRWGDPSCQSTLINLHTKGGITDKIFALSACVRVFPFHLLIKWHKQINQVQKLYYVIVNQKHLWCSQIRWAKLLTSPKSTCEKQIMRFSPMYSTLSLIK